MLLVFTFTFKLPGGRLVDDVRPEPLRLSRDWSLCFHNRGRGLETLAFFSRSRVRFESDGRLIE
jgi:hypothetical protein